jgi:hypothetical protein
LGVARLISSATTMFAKIGPRWRSNVPASRRYTSVPVMSAGKMSGVIWTRL